MPLPDSPISAAPDASKIEGPLGALGARDPAAAADLLPIIASVEVLRNCLAEAEVLNRRLAEVSARATELVAENEIKNESIALLNSSLSGANARAAELVAENEIRTQELAEANAFLRDAVEKKSKWLGFAAHDLRGGIGGIHGLVSMLLDGADGECGHGTIVEPLKLVEEESARLLELLSSLLEMARGEQGRISLDRAPTDLAALTLSAIAFHTRAASAKNQTIASELGAGCPTVVADPHRIRQVIDNLISNAIKFGPPGSQLDVSLTATGNEVVWSVADQGPGLAPEDFPKLFQSFQKLSALPTAGESSTGLGLALSGNIVELHLGRIWAENRTDGMGAMFSFALPTATAAPASHRVLILDSDPACRNLACAVLAGLGHVATACESLSEVVHSTSDGRPDAILADIRMSPRELRAALDAGNAAAPQIPLVALSSTDEVLGDAAAGWAGQLLKPLDPELLRAMLHRLLQPIETGAR